MMWRQASRVVLEALSFDDKLTHEEVGMGVDGVHYFNQEMIFWSE